MRKTFCSKAIGMLLWGLSLTALSTPIMAANISGDMGFDRASRAGTWRFLEDSDYSYAKGSASKLLSVKEVVPHHTLSITIQENLVNSFTFRVGCMLQTSTPMFELKMPSLDIRMFDTLNEVAYARFMVDENQEYSLRGEVATRNRLLFAPITKAQEQSINDLYAQMQKGKLLKIGVLQGERAKAREYEIPLDGFTQYVSQLNNSCVTFNRYYQGQHKYLPDYMAKEPEGYAQKNYSLMPKDPNADLVNSAQILPPKPVEPEPTPEPAPAPEPQTPPEVIPFTPGGGPVSIGPDGLPIGADGSGLGATSGQPVEQALGTVNSAPVQIGADGAPVQPGQAPAQPAQGGEFEPVPQEDSSIMDIF